MWSKRSRKTLDKWQERTGYRIITVAAGGKIAGEYMPTLYELPLLEVIGKVVDAGSDMRAAAFAHLSELRNDQRKSKIERFDNRPRTEGKAMAQRCREAALTHSERMCIEEMNALSIAMPRAEAIAHAEAIAEEFSREMLNNLRKLLATGQTRKERAEANILKNQVVENEDVAATDRVGSDSPPPLDLYALTEEKNEDKNDTAAPLDAAACVSSFDVAKFQVTMLDDRKQKGSRPEFYQVMTSVELHKSLPVLLERNEARSESLIIRPVATCFIQLDDLDSLTLARVQQFSFIAIETSPDSYQAWLALPVGTDKAVRDDVRSRILCKLELADKCASGAMRLPGSLNCKPEHRRADETFPRVRLVQCVPSRFVTVAELERAGLLALPKLSPAQPRRASIRSVSSERLPNYIMRRKASGEVDRSASDFDFALRALRCGFAQPDVEARLLEVSAKAQARRRSSYVRRTVERAACIIAAT
jgi:hypothetical protein